MLIEFLEMFLGAFNYFFKPENSNYYWFAQILALIVLSIILLTSCLAFLILLKNLLNITSKFGGRK